METLPSTLRANLTVTQNNATVGNLATMVFSSLIMLVIMIGAAIGNILVIVAVIKYEKLRIITNYVIVSLACADLLVAMLAMPFNFSIHITGKWMFSRVWCDIYFSHDVLFSTASILHICLISTDRYIAIVHPLRYESKMTPCRVSWMLGVTWAAAALISYIPINTQIYTTPENYKLLQNDPYRCEFVVNYKYALISSTISFWIPCVIMIFLYARIYLVARRQEKQIQSLMLNKHLASPKLANNERGRNSHEDLSRNESRRMKREHKAAKTLGIIMGAFILCWLPFFLWYLTWTICGEQKCPISGNVITVLFWIGYFNSTINPIIYAYFNRDFRTAFKKLLRLDLLCKNDPSAMALNVTFNSEHRDSATIQLTDMTDRANRSPCRYAHTV